MNDPRPDYLQAVLSIGDLGIINSNQARSLRNQEVFSRRRVVHVRAHQRLYFAGQVGVDSLLKNGWNVPAHFHFVLTKRRSADGFQIIIDGASPRLFDESLFSLLVVLQVVIIISLHPCTRRSSAASG